MIFLSSSTLISTRYVGVASELHLRHPSPIMRTLLLAPEKLHMHGVRYLLYAM